LGLARYRIDLDNFKGCIADELNQRLKITDRNGDRLTIRQFVSDYESASTLGKYFFKPRFSSKIFGAMKWLGYVGVDNAKESPEQATHYDSPQTQQQAITIVGPSATANAESIDNNNNTLNIPQLTEIPDTSEGPNLLSSSSVVVREENNNDDDNSNDSNNSNNNNNNKSVSGLQPAAAQQGIVLAIKQQREQQNNNNNLFKCFHCDDQSFASDKQRIDHVSLMHPGKMYYPTPEDFENRLYK
jgi:hypothetical protein